MCVCARARASSTHAWCILINFLACSPQQLEKGDLDWRLAREARNFWTASAGPRLNKTPANIVFIYFNLIRRRLLWRQAEQRQVQTNNTLVPPHYDNSNVCVNKQTHPKAAYGATTERGCVSVVLVGYFWLVVATRGLIFVVAKGVVSFAFAAAMEAAEAAAVVVHVLFALPFLFPTPTPSHLAVYLLGRLGGLLDCSIFLTDAIERTRTSCDLLIIEYGLADRAFYFFVAAAWFVIQTPTDTHTRTHNRMLYVVRNGSCWQINREHDRRETKTLAQDHTRHEAPAISVCRREWRRCTVSGAYCLLCIANEQRI